VAGLVLILDVSDQIIPAVLWRHTDLSRWRPRRHKSNLHRVSDLVTSLI